MIISHEHKFIFIKSRKTAGTSIEMALEKICGPDDVITPDGPIPTKNDVLLPKARNYKGRFNPIPELAMARSAVDVGRILRDSYKWPKYYNHMRAYSVKSRTNFNIWDGYYKFCFERNSWDKAISFYYWFNRADPNRVSVGDFIRMGGKGGTADRSFPTDWARYTLDNKIILDDVYGFDDIAGGLRTALGKAGVSDEVIRSVEIPRLKSEVRDRGASFRFDDASNRVIETIFAKEIRTFSYTMPNKFR